MSKNNRYYYEHKDDPDYKERHRLAREKYRKKQHAKLAKQEEEKILERDIKIVMEATKKNVEGIG